MIFSIKFVAIGILVMSCSLSSVVSSSKELATTITASTVEYVDTKMLDDHVPSLTEDEEDDGRDTRDTRHRQLRTTPTKTKPTPTKTKPTPTKTKPTKTKPTPTKTKPTPTKTKPTKTKPTPTKTKPTSTPTSSTTKSTTKPTTTKPTTTVPPSTHPTTPPTTTPTTIHPPYSCERIIAHQKQIVLSRKRILDIKSTQVEERKLALKTSLETKKSFVDSLKLIRSNISEDKVNMVRLNQKIERTIKKISANSCLLKIGFKDPLKEQYCKKLTTKLTVLNKEKTFGEELLNGRKTAANLIIPKIDTLTIGIQSLRKAIDKDKNIIARLENQLSQAQRILEYNKSTGCK